MAEEPSPYRGGWAYVNLLSALPGITVTPRIALVVQFILFETLAFALAGWYGAWAALGLATVGVTIATVGSAMMLSLTRRIRQLSLPAIYHRTLFHSSIDVVMGLVAFVAFLTYLLIAAPDGGNLFVRLLGEPLPIVPVFLGLFIAWDVSYRIGTAWWVSITTLWLVVVIGVPENPATRRGFLRVELVTICFALLQLLLVPFLWADRLLAYAVIGHVVAVLVVSGLTATLLRGGFGRRGRW